VLTPQAHRDGLAEAELVPPSRGGAEKEVIAVGEIGDRDGVAAPRVPPDQVEGEQTAADERREPGCPQQASNDDVHQSLSRERTNARLVARR